MFATRDFRSQTLATAELVLKAWAILLAEVWKTKTGSIESRGEFSPCSKLLNDVGLNYPACQLSKSSYLILSYNVLNLRPRGRATA